MERKVSMLMLSVFLSAGLDYTFAEDVAPTTELAPEKASNMASSSFVVWGRSQCPAETSTTVYSGTVGGAHYRKSGGGSNNLCLTLQPKFDNTPLEKYFGILDGAEYYVPGQHATDPVCALCRAPYSTTFMLPGSDVCPEGSVRQYQGHLTSGDYKSSQASEFLCLHAEPEARPDSDHPATYRAFLEHVRTRCSSLPCPPYVNDRVVICAVCSMN